MKIAGSMLVAVVFIQMSLVSHPGNWLQTSSSSMYSYVIAMAVKRGYVHQSYEAVARKGYRGVLTKLSLDADGLANITGIVQQESTRLMLPASVALLSNAQSGPRPASGAASNANPQSSDAVKYFSSAEVHAAFEKGSPLINKDGRTYWVIAGKRDKPGQSELHEKDIDVFYVLQGSATFVTGGKMLEPKTTAPGEVRGSGIEGGETHTLSKDDVIIIPAGVPHWFKDVQGTFLYFVVKVQ